MVLHPAGGSIEHLLRITTLIVITHSIAVFSLPFGCIGFWGLTRKLGTDQFLPLFAFVTAAFGLIAVMLAATTNGLILPIFLQHYKDASPEDLAAIKPILRYGFAINHAFDYIYTFAFCLAIGCWSVAILLTRQLPIWIGWIGIVIAVLTAVIFASDVAVNSLSGLRIFMACLIGWIPMIGVTLYRQK